MASGGARARSGKAADPLALRGPRPSEQRAVVLLPGPREGDAPEWPAQVPEPSVAELAMWVAEWRRPQAHVWELNGLEVVVAQFVRTYIAAMDPEASPPMRTSSRQMMDALGISLDGMAKMGWQIVTPPDAASEDRKGRAVTRAQDLGLTILEGGQ